jgi:uncharacterized protein YodC (DUF2158 family)
MTLRVGNKVHLVSGGPTMTVESVETVGAKTMVHCVWFDHEHNERRGSYPEAALVQDDATPSR